MQYTRLYFILITYSRNCCLWHVQTFLKTLCFRSKDLLVFTTVLVAISFYGSHKSWLQIQLDKETCLTCVIFDMDLFGTVSYVREQAINKVSMYLIKRNRQLYRIQYILVRVSLQKIWVEVNWSLNLRSMFAITEFWGGQVALMVMRKENY